MYFVIKLARIQMKKQKIMSVGLMTMMLSAVFPISAHGAEKVITDLPTWPQVKSAPCGVVPGITEGVFPKTDQYYVKAWKTDTPPSIPTYDGYLTLTKQIVTETMEIVPAEGWKVPDDFPAGVGLSRSTTNCERPDTKPVLVPNGESFDAGKVDLKSHVKRSGVDTVSVRADSYVKRNGANLWMPELYKTLDTSKPGWHVLRTNVTYSDGGYDVVPLNVIVLDENGNVPAHFEGTTMLAGTENIHSLNLGTRLTNGSLEVSGPISAALDGGGNLIVSAKKIDKPEFGLVTVKDGDRVIDTVYFNVAIKGVDADKDGIIDGLDDCPDTSIGDEVNVKGCAIRKAPKVRGPVHTWVGRVPEVRDYEEILTPSGEPVVTITSAPDVTKGGESVAKLRLDYGKNEIINVDVTVQVDENIYEANADGSRDGIVPSHYKKVRVQTGIGAKEMSARVFYVNPYVEVELPVSEPQASPGYVFSGWDKPVKAVFDQNSEIFGLFEQISTKPSNTPSVSAIVKVQSKTKASAKGLPTTGAVGGVGILAICTSLATAIFVAKRSNQSK